MIIRKKLPRFSQISGIIPFIVLSSIVLPQIAHYWLRYMVTTVSICYCYFPFPFSFQKVLDYTRIAKNYQAAIDNVLWNEREGTWLDYDMRNKRSKNTFYPSNLTPLYTMSYDKNKSAKYAQRTISYLKRNKIDTYFGKLNYCPLHLVSMTKYLSFLFLLIWNLKKNAQVSMLFSTVHYNCWLNFW